MTDKPFLPSYLDTVEREPLENGTRYLTALKQLPDATIPATKLEDFVNDALDPALVNHFFFQVLLKRLVQMRPDLNFSPLVMLMCVAASDRVGMAVCWGYTMVDFQRRYGRPMRLADWDEEFGQKGVPTENELIRIWDAQKQFGREGRGLSDNQIDDREAWADQPASVQ